MRILHTVEYYWPSVGGAQEVVQQISERLAERGHEVTVATSTWPGRTASTKNGVRIEEFDIKGNMVKGLSGDIEKYEQFLRNGQFDIIMNYAAQSWPTDIAFRLLDDLGAKKVFVPCGFSSLSDPSYSEYYLAMKDVLKKYDACVYLSNNYRDINYSRSMGVTNSIIIPNGASEKEFGHKQQIDIRSKLNIEKDTLLVLHVGSHTGLKGHQEAMRIFKKAKINDATLLIVANDFGRGCGSKCKWQRRLYNSSLLMKQARKRIIISELPRPETISAYQQADLFLLPSRIECSPLVLFESMAAGLPFLTTDVGNAAEIIEWSGGGGILLPTVVENNGLAKALINGSTIILTDLVNDEAKRIRMGSAGRVSWENNFTWEKISREYEDLYHSLLNGKHPNNGQLM